MGLNLSRITDAAKNGVQTASSMEAAEVLVALAKKTLGKSYPKFFNSGVGKTIEPVIIPMFIIVYVDSFVTKKTALHEKLAFYSALALEGFTASTVKEYMSVLKPLMESFLSEAGSALPELPA